MRCVDESIYLRGGRTHNGRRHHAPLGPGLSQKNPAGKAMLPWTCWSGECPLEVEPAHEMRLARGRFIRRRFVVSRVHRVGFLLARRELRDQKHAKTALDEILVGAPVHGLARGQSMAPGQRVGLDNHRAAPARGIVPLAGSLAADLADLLREREV